MTDAMAFDPSPNVLYHGVPLRHVMELPVLGVPVHFASNSATALAVVEEACGSWRGLCTSPGLISPLGVRVRLIGHDGYGSGSVVEYAHAHVTFAMPECERIILQPPCGEGAADS